MALALPDYIASAIAGFIGSGVSGGTGTTPLLSDNFVGNGALNGRVPQIGPAWVTTGPNGADMATSGGEMSQTTGTGVGYGTSAVTATIGEVGCTFRLTQVTQSAILSGTPGTGDLFIANVYLLNSDTSFFSIQYTFQSGNSLADMTAGLAALITANGSLAAQGTSSTSVGASIFLNNTVRSTRVDWVAVPVGGSISVAQNNSPVPTMANYITGTNFLTGMIHFRLDVSGILDWSFYNSGVIPFTTTSRRLVGLQPSVTYTYRACIGPPYVWGGIWQGSTLMSAFMGQDVGIAALNGKSCFLETGGTAVLFFGDAWAYSTPSVSRATIQAVVP